MSDTFIFGIADLSISRAAGVPGASVDSSRSFLSEVKAFPTNIEVRAMLTFSAPAAGGLGRPPGRSGAPSRA